MLIAIMKTAGAKAVGSFSTALFATILEIINAIKPFRSFLN